MRKAFIIAISLAMGACGSLTEICSTALHAGIRLAVVDEATGLPITDATGTVVATDGAYSDTSQVDFAGVASLAFDRPGKYEVRVEIEGYAVWAQNDVMVIADECHVKTVSITANLQAK